MTTCDLPIDLSTKGHHLNLNLNHLRSSHEHSLQHHPYHHHHHHESHHYLHQQLVQEQQRHEQQLHQLQLEYLSQQQQQLEAALGQQHPLSLERLYALAVHQHSCSSTSSSPASQHGLDLLVARSQHPHPPSFLGEHHMSPSASQLVQQQHQLAARLEQHRLQHQFGAPSSSSPQEQLPTTHQSLFHPNHHILLHHHHPFPLTSSSASSTTSSSSSSADSSTSSAASTSSELDKPQSTSHSPQQASTGQTNNLAHQHQPQSLPTTTHHNTPSTNPSPIDLHRCSTSSSTSSSSSSSSSHHQLPASHQLHDKKRINRPLTGKHVKHGTGASIQTLLTLRKVLKQRQQTLTLK